MSPQSREVTRRFFTTEEALTNPRNQESEWGDSRLPPELPVLLAAHPNILIVGTEQTQDAAVRALSPYLRQPVKMLSSASAASLPSGGSVILRTIGDLTLQAQEELFSWLEGGGRDTQVVSLSPVQLFPLVTDGRFLEDLYYRINIVQFDSNDSVDGGHPLSL